MYISVNNKFGRRIIDIRNIRSIEAEPVEDAKVDGVDGNENEDLYRLYRLVVYGEATLTVDGEYAIDAWTIAEGTKEKIEHAMGNFEFFLGKRRREIVDGEVYIITSEDIGMK